MKKERAFLFTLAAVQFTHIMDFMIMMPLGPQLMRLFDINPQEFSLLVSSYTFSAGLSGLLAAMYIDRFDRKTVMQYCYAGFLLGTLACAFAPNYHFLMLARILTGAFGGITGSLVLSMVGDNIPLERRASAMGIVMTAFSIASVFGVPFGLYLATLFSWHAPFLFLAGAGLIIYFMITRVIPPMNKHLSDPGRQNGRWQSFIMVAKNPNQIRALLLMMCLMMGHFTIIPFISPYMVSNVGFTEGQLPYIYLTGGLVSIVSLPVIGKLADKYGRYRIFTFGILSSLIPLFLITNMPPVAVSVALLITCLFFLTMGGRTIPASTMITATVHPHQRGSFMSLNSAVQQMSCGIAAFIGGLIITKSPTGQLVNYNIVGFIGITFSLLCLWLAKGVKPVTER